MPSRTYNILAAGKPILALAEPDSEIARVVLEDEVGWVVSPDDSKKLLEVIERICSDKKNLNEIGARSRKSAIVKYSFETAVNRYKEALR